LIVGQDVENVVMKILPFVESAKKDTTWIMIIVNHAIQDVNHARVGINCTSCSLGFVSVAGYCEECHHTCLECSPLDVNECTKCRRGLNLENTTCVSTCERGCF